MRDKIIRFFLTQKFRWDLAVGFLVFVNFGLLVITASSQVQLLLNKYNINFDVYSIVIYLIVISFFGTWVFGYLLDRYIKYYDNMMTVANSRNPQISEILENTRELLKKEKK